MGESALFDRPIAPWLRPVDGVGSPCGPDIEYDDEFLELQRAAEGKPAAQFSAAVPPDWSLAREKAESLLSRSRDLRVAVYWSRAAVNLDGFAALAPGLMLLRGLVTNFWEHLHPLPDDGDHYARANALAMLAHGDGLCGDLRRCVVCKAPGAGELRLRSISAAYGPQSANADSGAYTREQISQFLAAAVAEHPQLAELPRAARAAAQALLASIDEKFGPQAGPDLGALLDLIQVVGAAMPVPMPVPMPQEAAPESRQGVAAAATAATTPGSGEIRSRDDAIRAIDLVCEFLDRTEPSNPAQMLLRRARRLINRDFLQLIKELAPEALPEASRVLGVDPETVTVR